MAVSANEVQTGITELRIKGYRSIKSAVIPLNALTVFVGPNGAGKTNILRSLNLLRAMVRNQFTGMLRGSAGAANVLWRNGNGDLTDSIGIGVRMMLDSKTNSWADYAIEYGFPTANPVLVRERCIVHSNTGIQSFDRTPDHVETSFPLALPEVSKHAALLPYLAGLSGFGPVWESLSNCRVFAFSPSKIRESDSASQPFDQYLTPDGTNLASVLAQIQLESPDVFERINDHMASVLPETTVVLKDVDDRTYLRFVQRTKTGELTLSPSQMSDGTLRALGLLTAVYQPNPPFAIPLEEPESTIHPGALTVLLDVLAIGSRSHQVLVTTHSPDVLEWADLPTNALRLVEWIDGATHVQALGESDRSIIEGKLMNAGQLLRANALQFEEFHDAEINLFPKLG